MTLGELVLRAFDSISEHARGKLSGGVRPGGSPLLPEEARRNLLRILYEDRQALQTLQHEPSIARVEVTWLDTNEEEVLYVCRTSSAGIRPDGLDGQLVSYRAALGRLAAIPAGKEVEVALPRGERPALVQVRAELHPSPIAAGWDSIDNSFELIDWHAAIESIRRLLDYERQAPPTQIVSDFLAQMFAEDEAQQVYLGQRRRKIVDRMQLRDRPVLDQFQDLIFRLPLDKQLFLLGPPGTGKTTTLIKRLGQKRTEEALTVEETDMLTLLGMKDDFLAPSGWVMFSPTELLKLYVQEAFNRERIPAPRQNLRTWDAERISIGRDVGNIQEVRVFDIQHVKGLEFEAVFFVGADSLAERLPDLFDRYIYVGITRAAAFLGITCQARLPKNLEFVRGWRIRPGGFCRDVCDPRYVDAITAYCPCPRSNRHSRNRTSRRRGTTASPPRV